MFGNKKNILSPKPKLPDVDEILRDLNNSINEDDITFKLLVHESAYTDSSISTEFNDINNVYEKTKLYLDVNKKLRVLQKSIDKHEKQLESSVKNMIELKEQIKNQAQAALIQEKMKNI